MQEDDEGLIMRPYTIDGDDVWWVTEGRRVRICGIYETFAAAVDVSNGVLHSHGHEDFVQEWADRTKSAFTQGGFPQYADDLVVHRFAVTPEAISEVNACIRSTGRAMRLGERLRVIGETCGLAAMAPMGRC